MSSRIRAERFNVSVELSGDLLWRLLAIYQAHRRLSRSLELGLQTAGARARERRRALRRARAVLGCWVVSPSRERLVYEADIRVKRRGRRVRNHEAEWEEVDAGLGLDPHHPFDRVSPRRIRLPPTTLGRRAARVGPRRRRGVARGTALTLAKCGGPGRRCARLTRCVEAGERGLLAPALLVARPALTGFVPQPPLML